MDRKRTEIHYVLSIIIMKIHCITVDTKPATIKNLISMQKSKCHLELGSFKNEIRKDILV